MSTEELLRPRYKVIADYFYNPYKIGDIITVMYDDRSVHLTTTRYRDEFGEMIDQHNYMHPGELKKFPHLFKKLEWWEERKIEDMPEYVKCVKTPDQNIKPEEVFKVKWCTPSAGRAATGQWIVADTNCYIPATSSEYEQYINQQKQTNE